MQITRFGFTDDELAVARARDEFARTHCAVLPAFLAPDLARRFTFELLSEAGAPAVYHLDDGREFGRDFSFSQASGVLHALHLLLNNQRLFTAIRHITGCAPIGCFAGRAYRSLPASEQRLDWHDDTLD